VGHQYWRVFFLAAALIHFNIYWGYNNSMNLEFDQDKRDKTLLERGLDYEEDRFITVGWLEARLVVVVWTPRGEVRRIISMRKANDREKALYPRHLE
jgi:uncharacterized DUF497 family protein